jgi:hypothetical protein
MKIEKQSESDSGKEEVAPATETDSDAFDPGHVVTESDITASAPAPRETYGNTDCMQFPNLQLKSIIFFFFAITCINMVFRLTFQIIFHFHFK